MGLVPTLRILRRSNRLMISPDRRDPDMLPIREGRRCADATVFEARSVIRKYRATDENIYGASSARGTVELGKGGFSILRSYVL